MAIRVIDTGKTDAGGNPIYEVVEDVTKTRDSARTVAEMTARESQEDEFLVIVTALRNFVRDHPESGRRALEELSKCGDESSANDVRRRQQQRKQFWTDALAAVAALP